jgi:hypothetical protein
MSDKMVQRDEPVFAIAQRPAPGALAEAQQSRAMAEVQSAMIVAKKFPRDEAAAFARIMQSCQRKSLADSALYSYPKGGQTVTGPSIRLAEALAMAWGNLDFGIIELEQRAGESEMMAYAWDLETNTKQTKVFHVRHERHTKTATKTLDDPRDIYELTANQGARRLRACILGVIPGDVVEAAVARCEETMRTGERTPLADRVRKMVAAFADQGVTQAMVEQRLGHKLDSTSETELVGLRKVFQSIRDGMAGVDQFFSRGEDQQAPAAKAKNGILTPPEEQPPANPMVEEAVSACERYAVAHQGVIPDWMPESAIAITRLDDAHLSALLDRIASEEQG